MTTEVEQQEQVSADTESKAMEAAFGEGFNDLPPTAAPEPKKDEPAAAPAQAEPAAVAEPVKEVEAAPAPAATPSPSPAPAVDYAAELRKVNGRIGDLNSQLQQALKTKEAEGKPAALTTFELKKLRAEYPDMADVLHEDLTEVIASLKPAAIDPKVIETLVSERVSREISGLRVAAVTDAHETWQTDLWVGGELGKERTPEYAAWLKTMPETEASAFETNDNPYAVIKKLNQFYDWKAKDTKAKAEKQDRLMGAVTPQGVPRAGKSTMSDDEALRKGFEEGFNS